MSTKKTKNDMGYSNSFRSLEAIWTVLREHASKDHPLTVREICEYLENMSEAPSADTVKRIFPAEHTLMNLLYPGEIHEAGSDAMGAFYDADGLHIVIETPDGEVVSSGEMDLEVTTYPLRVPSYSTVDKLLKEGIPFDLQTFPFRLRCVAKTSDKAGKVRYIPYEQFEDLGKKNNQPRRYYLANMLTEAEWRIFSDLVQVYPYISERQTKKFIEALNHMKLKRTLAAPNRYASKRGSEAQFSIIHTIDEAISRNRKVRVIYGEYKMSNENGKWTPVLKEREHSGILDVEPYALMWSNGNYYLVAKHRGMMNLRVDRIIKVGLLEEKYEIPGDFDPVKYRDSSPVMYPGEKTFIKMRCNISMLNVILDFFGEMPEYTAPKDDETIEITMFIAPNGVKLFALQYAEAVEVLEPASLREDVKKTLEKALEKYSS